MLKCVADKLGVVSSCISISAEKSPHKMHGQGFPLTSLGKLDLPQRQAQVLSKHGVGMMQLNSARLAHQVRDRRNSAPVEGDDCPGSPLVVERKALEFLPSCLAATIYQRHDAGPMRPVGRRRGIRPGGLYYSQKMGRLVGYESDNEKCDFYRAEVLTSIVGYREQPHTIEAVIDGKTRRYTPDREDVFADGRLEIVEVKDEYEACKDPGYNAKLVYFAEVYQRLGWSFRLTTREEIKGSSDFETFENIQRFRRASYNAAEVADVRRILSGHDECHLGDLLALFYPALAALPKLCAMMVGRIIILETGSKLEANSIVKLA